jgi:hypothetical protein
VGGFTIPQPPAMSAGSTAPGIANLPHPTLTGATTCQTCHSDGGGKLAIAYDHASTLIASNCSSCHEAGSDLVATPWNGATTVSAGLGDTRPITINPITVDGKCSVSSSSHFYPVDCKECHTAPSGIAGTSTGSAHNSAWNFPHRERNIASATCRICHGPCDD